MQDQSIGARDCPDLAQHFISGAQLIFDEEMSKFMVQSNSFKLLYTP